MNQKYQHIILEKFDSYWQVWLNRPEKHNAMNGLMIRELTELFKIVDESKTQVIVLRGKGKSFCSGADLSWMKNADSMSMEENTKDAAQLAELLFTLYNLPVPVIAIAHGAVYGGAIGLLSACDFVFAENKTTFSFSEVKLGLSPSTIMPYVLKRLSKAHAKELIFTAKVFTPQEALLKGLIDQVIEEDNIQHIINFYALQLKHSEPGAIKESKRLINSLNGEINETILDSTVKSLAERRNSKEALKRINAFLNKK